MRVDSGEKDGVNLAGRSFIVLMLAPGPMGEGNMKVGLIVDDGASDEQTAAITEIATGSAGGPMAALGPLVGEFAGVEKRPIRFEMDGLNRSVTAGEPGRSGDRGRAERGRGRGDRRVDNTAHPVNSRLALAKATRSHMHAFGIDWDDDTGTRNGHFAPFSWNG